MFFGPVQRASRSGALLLRSTGQFSSLRSRTVSADEISGDVVAKPNLSLAIPHILLPHFELSIQCAPFQATVGLISTLPANHNFCHEAGYHYAYLITPLVSQELALIFFSCHHGKRGQRQIVRWCR